MCAFTLQHWILHMTLHNNPREGVFGARSGDPGQWESVLSKNWSADLFRRFAEISSPIAGGGG